MTAFKDDVLCPDSSHVSELGITLSHVFSPQQQFLKETRSCNSFYSMVGECFAKHVGLMSFAARLVLRSTSQEPVQRPCDREHQM
jgi:hypothetical protein